MTELERALTDGGHVVEDVGLTPSAQRLMDRIGALSAPVAQLGEYLVVDAPEDTDLAAVTAAVRTLVDRHEALRLCLAEPFEGLLTAAVLFAYLPLVPLVLTLVHTGYT